MEEMLCMNDRFRPVMAVPISVTVMMPMTIPSVVSTDRILLARIAAQAITKPSLISLKKVI
jgi:hypothetical protein